jgi:hypothetical protein
MEFMIEERAGLAVSSSRAQVEGSRGENLKVTWRDPSTALGMTEVGYVLRRTALQ